MATPAPLREPPRLPPSYRTRMMEAASAQPVVSEPGRTRWWLPIAICLLGGVGGAAIYELWTLARQPRWVELSLSAKPAVEAGMLAITWDASAPRAAGATHGLLGITDAGTHRDIALSREQLQTGQYDYKPASQDLDVRLLLYGNGPAVSGSALRLLPAPAPMHAAEIHPPSVAPPPSRPVQKTRGQTGRSSRHRRR